ncbi:uncharacterized protein BYT42DRAFT_493605 [Radiomyces spectabilis]|uniref:uncharacterized protein n=1 Tax=Radiomyces spectabilis TaxID=64574 RepID=UPI00221F7024|nr:uncharacterized protein BYT42DRAFT_493605 [Radiomyces spectabilis]KAI8384862.1 hypothetical protein BYT42DRAFT_493605 [Radiomyces spectabilis]
MLALAAAEEPALDTTLRTRLAGPSSHKAGLDEVDKEQVNRIIYEASKGSSFFENERKKDAATTKRIEALLVQYEKIRHNDLSLETRIVDHMLHDMESKRDLTQVICHVDMDAFYASVEELERPELKQVPMAVGSIGMLCTSNYIARKYGVRSAMPGYIALKLCPSLQIIPLHFPKYRAASAKVRAIFAKYDPHFCPMSLDEAYLNLTEYLKTSDLNPAQLVEKIRQEIFEETQLTASAGIAANRMLAKVCSDINKPNGQFYLPNDQEAIFEFVDPLRIRKVPGIGRVTERILEALEVKTCGDVYRQRAILYKLLSPINFKFMLKCHLGIGSTTISEETVRKSISVERTFRAISDTTLLMEKVDELAVLLAQDLAKSNVEGKTITIKLKLTTFELRTRAKTIPAYTSQTSDITRIARELLLKELPVNLRLMGLRMSNLRPRGQDDQGVKKVSQSDDPGECFTKLIRL